MMLYTKGIFITNISHVIHLLQYTGTPKREVYKNSPPGNQDTPELIQKRPLNNTNTGRMQIFFVL
jgi:hypothetical protein